MLPQLLERLVDEALHGTLVGDVRGDPDPVRERGGRLLGALQVGDDDPRALAREALRERPADPLGRPRDDRDLAVERAHD